MQQVFGGRGVVRGSVNEQPQGEKEKKYGNCNDGIPSPLPPFTTRETAIFKKRCPRRSLAGEGIHRDPGGTGKAGKKLGVGGPMRSIYTMEERFRVRATDENENHAFFSLANGAKELDYGSSRDLWAFTGNRIAGTLRVRVGGAPTNSGPMVLFIAPMAMGNWGVQTNERAHGPGTGGLPSNQRPSHFGIRSYNLSMDPLATPPINHPGFEWGPGALANRHFSNERGKYVRQGQQQSFTGPVRGPKRAGFW